MQAARKMVAWGMSVACVKLAAGGCLLANRDDFTVVPPLRLPTRVAVSNMGERRELVGYRRYARCTSLKAMPHRLRHSFNSDCSRRSACWSREIPSLKVRECLESAAVDQIGTRAAMQTPSCPLPV
jgi:hypothetical protein